MEVSLHDILQAREKRAREQQRLLAEYRTPLICFTMNIAGPIKTSALIRRGFRAGLEALDRQLPEGQVLYKNVTAAAAGCEAMYCVSMDARSLKALCTAIEDSTPLGRLFDMDVLDTNGTKLERTNLRGCIVCGAPGRGCAAGRLHSVAQLQDATTQILREHFARTDRKWIAAAAVQSLIDEVHTTPKPGLVDLRNSGSHTDMDIGLFTASARALEPYFAECVKIGQDTADRLPEDTFSLLRRAGLDAEETMYRTTGGVNTHKGAIYTLGILCGSLGRLWTPETPAAHTEQVLSQCAMVVRRSVESDFAGADGSTAGQALYLKQGIKGIRGEVAAGLPSVANISLPAYKNGLSSGLTSNDAGTAALLHLIAGVEDTNLYHRGGSEGAAWAAEAAHTLLQISPVPTLEQLEALDDAFIARRLSPGGCADLLAVTYFLHSLDPQV